MKEDQKHDYAEHLDWDAKGMAQITGIAFGWDQSESEYTGQQLVRCGCNYCGILVERLWESGKHEEGDIEQEVLTEFRRVANEQGCRHFGKFLQVHQEPAYLKTAGVLGFAQLVEREGLVGEKKEDGREE